MLGQVKHGVYDHTDTIDPAVLHHYYGAGPSRADDPDEGESQRDLAEVITEAQSRNIRHEAADVGRNSSPFTGNDKQYTFALALGSALALEAYPAGFHLSEPYESSETYQTGRSTRPLIIPLPCNVWFPRIVVWCKALDLLKWLPMCRAMAS